jgi:hypothetical protein
VTPFFPWLLMQVKPCGYAILNPKPWTSNSKITLLYMRIWCMHFAFT